MYQSQIESHVIIPPPTTSDVDDFRHCFLVLFEPQWSAKSGHSLKLEA